jgi:hypothetical protein
MANKQPEFTHVAIDIMQLKLGKQPTADFKHGWILGAAAAREHVRGVPWDKAEGANWQDKEWVAENNKKAAAETKANLLWAIGLLYDTVYAWDFCTPEEEPAMVQLAEKLATLNGGPDDPGYTVDPPLFGQTTQSKEEIEQCYKRNHFEENDG